MEFKLSPDDVKPIVREVVAAVLEDLGPKLSQLNGRLGFPEAEAAALLGIPPHVLRDCRLRREIKGSRVGKGTIYTPDELRQFLLRQQLN